MSTTIEWPEIFWRLFLTLIAGAIIGLNRGEHGHPAGLRTTMLVCLAASLSMIQVNLLLDMNGKTPSSFAVMDLMRLPLGILSGMGFIGAGAILRKDNLVIGVTTAATLWFVTVVGLCIGGGQEQLGMAALVLGVGILWGLKIVERHWHRDEKGVLTIVSESTGVDWAAISQEIQAAGGRIVRWTNINLSRDGSVQERTCDVAWKGCPDEPQPPSFLQKLLTKDRVLRVSWKQQG